MGRLDGKSALITGASRGIGRAIALRFAAEGCDVAINYVSEPNRNNLAEASEVADAVKALGPQCICVNADVTQLPAVEGMVGAAVNAFGALDILVCNAGINRDRTLHRLSKDEWDDVIAVNLTGAFNCARAASGHMRDREQGRMVFLSSVVGLMGNIGQTNYAASKAGLIGLAKSLAREMARRRVTVNCIAPGYVDTEMTQGVPPDVLAQVVERIPMERLGYPEEIAHAALFLASDEAAYITGQVISVNGGLYM